MPTKYSEYTENIISKQAPFIVRYGIIIFACILILIACFTWFIQYPDIIVANGKLANIHAPKTVLAHSDGKLIKLNVTENEDVTENTIVGYIESLVNAEIISSVEKKLNILLQLLQKQKLDSVYLFFNTNFNIVQNQHLGEIQTAYQNFMQLFNNYADYLPQGFYAQKMNKLNIDKQKINLLNVELKNQQTLMEQDLALTNDGFKANEKLLKDRIISPQDYRNEQTKLIAKQLNIPQIKSALINNTNVYNEKEKEIDEIKHQQQLQQNNFKQSILSLQTAIQGWQYKYVIKSPITGKFHFNNFIQENQDLKVNEAIGYVSPKATQYYVWVIIPQYNFGKVKIGQEVLLKFLAYPYEQYGAVLGKIDFINSIPTDSGYLCKIILPNNLITQYKKSIIFKDGLLVQASIITQQKRLLQRFYESFIKGIK